MPDNGDVARVKALSRSAASVIAMLFHEIRADCATEVAGTVLPMTFALFGLCGEEVPDIGGEDAKTFRHVEQDGEPPGGTKELVALRGVFE